MLARAFNPPLKPYATDRRGPWLWPFTSIHVNGGKTRPPASIYDGGSSPIGPDSRGGFSGDHHRPLVRGRNARLLLKLAPPSCLSTRLRATPEPENMPPVSPST
ncbi:hypothetical protein NUW54_g11951 [Trametes sanguinea]|uniref:Uncharacterized protein n=1 Tax=Trametes sanguinea TaxID=158606 RepID=A0ACC1N4A5_9APHY|nr:hypothetical protein NUW54_g11951 [Trametes sanguinea]